MKYFHVDVFSDKPLSGNGLTVVFIDQGIDDSILLKLAQEFKQFETIFIYHKKDEIFPVRVFTVQEELPFAGHPLLGAASVIHKIFYPQQIEKEIKLGLGKRSISLNSKIKNQVFSVSMNQGKAAFIKNVNRTEAINIANYFNLKSDDLNEKYPVEIVSTGLPYVLLPLGKNIGNARIVKDGLEQYIAKHHAKFVYLFDTQTLECRTWDNTGLFEDVATGSAAGPLIASLVHNRSKTENEKIKITQGTYLGRKSTITGWVTNDEVFIEGKVAFFGNGEISI